MVEPLSRDLLRVSQLEAVDFIKNTPFCAIFCDMGFGKTVTTLTAVGDLLDSKEIRKVLVVAPLRVARDTWPEGVAEWEHTTGITFKFIEGDAKERTASARGKEQVHFINQENFVWLAMRAGKRWPYDMVVFDDSKGFKSGKLKTAESPVCKHSDGCDMLETEKTGHCKKSGECERYVKAEYSDECVMRCADFKQVRGGSKACTITCVDYANTPSGYTRYGAIIALRPQIKRLVHLTGTPSSKELLDLWPLIHTIDMGQRLGRTYSQYKQKYFIKARGGYDFFLKPDAKSQIFDTIGDVCISIESEAELPPCTEIPIEVGLPPDVAKMYTTFEREFAVSIEDDEVQAVNAGVLAGKLLQICGGAVYHEVEGVKTWTEVHTEKIKALAGIIEQYEGEPILVGYNFAHELERLRNAFPEGVDIRDRRDAVKAWNAGEIPLMFAHPDSAGHGLNLQKGRGRVLVWFGLNWSLDLNKQLNKRLWRPGQKRECFIYYIVAKGRADARVMESIKRKDATQKELLRAVRRDALKTLKD